MMCNQLDIRDWPIDSPLWFGVVYSDYILSSDVPRVYLMKKAGNRPNPMSMKLKTIKALMFAF